VSAGAKVLIPIADQFYGDRSGRLEDPFGHVWLVSTHVEDVSPEEMQRRMEALSQKESGS
jgi:PhnB protein